MGKPSRTILVSKHFDAGDHGYQVEDVLRMETTWVILYDNELISLRREHGRRPGVFKYIKLMYPELGRAAAMAKRLNEDYQTDKFQVVKLEQLVGYKRPQDYVDLDSVDVQAPKRRQGRPTGQSVTTNSLIKRRLAVVEEIKQDNLGDLLG